MATTRALAVLAIVYLALVVNQERARGRAELLPFASWSLFTIVPNDLRDYSLRIHELDGVPLEPPVYFEESNLASATWHSAHVVIDRMGKAWRAGQRDEVHSLRGKFEANHLRDATRATYELVGRVYDPLERWRTRSFKQVEVLERFEKEAR